MSLKDERDETRCDWPAEHFRTLPTNSASARYGHERELSVFLTSIDAVVTLGGWDRVGFTVNTREILCVLLKVFSILIEYIKYEYCCTVTSCRVYRETR